MMVAAGTFQLVLLALQVVIGILLSLLAYMFRKRDQQIQDNSDQIKENERRWRYIAGDEEFDGDEGRLGAFDQLHQELRRDHKETRQRLQALSSQVRNLRRVIRDADAIDADIEAVDDGSHGVTDDD